MAEAWDTARIREAFIYDGGEAEYHDPERGAQTQRQVAGEIFDRWLAAHDAEILAAERERIIQDMQERSHPDDWGVPCVYVESYAERLRGAPGD